MKHSVQIYSIRNFGGSLEDRLALIRRVGFTHLESVATHELAPADFAATLARHGLALSSMHASLQLVEHQRATLVEACRLTGCRLVVMPFLAWGDRPRSAAGWRAMGARLAAIGRAFAAEGIRFAYHNHDWEFLAFDGRPGLAWLFDAADAQDLGWEADLGWVVRAGQDATSWLAREAARLAAVHAKDLAPEGQAVDEDGWTVLGQGLLPWADLAATLRPHTDLIVFEHDNPKDAEACLRGSLEYMRRTFV
jgi:sugar phosphate isomerase/epimerase